MSIKNQVNHIYAGSVCITGIILFFLHTQLQVEELSSWVLIYVLTGAVLLLNHFNIILPFSGDFISMDSAIYLACIFTFGFEFPLLVLFFSSIAYAFINIRIAWWKHIFNFANYSIMIIATYYVFTFSGGQPGAIEFTSIVPYILSLTVYFFLNIFIMWFYFYLSGSQSVLDMVKEAIRKEILKEFFTGYLSTLVLSLVLTILINTAPIFGLFLFIVLSIILSFAFRKFFSLYKDEEEKANKDFLTGLYNHGYFKLKLDDMLSKNEEGSTFTVALLDIDDFKKYNDQNGHLQGDELLKFFGHYLEDKMKSTAYLAARYGGEEFGVIFPKSTKSDAYMFLNTIRKELNDTVFKGVDDLPLGCISFSAGVIEYEKGTYGSSELLSKADKALYFAKAQGKNNVQVYLEGNNLYDDEMLIFKEVDALEQQLQIFLSKDIYTYQHSKRVFKYAADFSEKLALSNVEKRILILGALIHDIGKLEIPRDVINKKGKLELHEWEMMKRHVTYGKEIISSIKKYDELLPLIELHHERYDGMGYPYGLKGNNIPKLARILCIIDSFDAMTTERPYQKIKTFSQGIVELRKCAGQQFDSAYIEPFIEMIQENYKDRIASEQQMIGTT
ncbi:diguanylate cyclase domain-containing protein [Bacillus salitolerans]|uniref:Diguanylate cyclase domain-containing protein n=1 Tax=Bacillus salitolerans TaxID=1437434 RepID=A0ABW4LS60_9BACI